MTAPQKVRKPVTFIRKLYYDILESGKYSHLICWTSDGMGFKVLDKQRLVDEVLKVIYNEKHYISFTRNLKLYKFELKDGVYRHPDFNRFSTKRLTNFRRSKKQDEKIESPKSIIEQCTLPCLPETHSYRSLDEEFQQNNQLPSDDGFYNHFNDLDKFEVNLSDNDNILHYNNPFTYHSSVNDKECTNDFNNNVNV